MLSRVSLAKTFGCSISSDAGGGIICCAGSNHGRLQVFIPSNIKYHHHYKISNYHWQCSMFDVHHRMREMFKPSMAELGLCMYQVAKHSPNKYPNITQSPKSLKDADICFLFQLDTLVQEHIPDLYVHFQSQVSPLCSTSLINHWWLQKKFYLNVNVSFD